MTPIASWRTEGRIHEINILKKLSLNAGAIVAIDRGLVDYELFGDWTRNGVYLVTPLKHNADYRVVKNNPVPKNRNIVKDQLIRLNGFNAKDNCPFLLLDMVIYIYYRLNESK